MNITRLFFNSLKNTRRFSSSSVMESPKIAVVLSGNGVYDGSEVHEACATLASINRAGGEVLCYAPNEEQMHVIDHTKGEPAANEKRNVLVESARIARGNVKPLSELTSASADAVIFPGGFGAAKNLCDFAVNGANMTVKPDVERILKDFNGASKPIGLCCISPVIAAKVFGSQGIKLTLGKADDGSGKWPFGGSIEAAKSMGANTLEQEVNEIVVDEKLKIVTTPAFMYGAAKFHEIQDGVAKMVEAVVNLTK